MTRPLVYDLTLAPGTDWNYGFTVQSAPTAFDPLTIATGLAITALLCASEAEPVNGVPAPIDTSLDVTCQEVGAGTGNYNVGFAGADTLAHLTPFYDGVVFLCLKIGTQLWATLRVKVVRSLPL